YRQPAELLRNLGGGGHWIEIALVGVRSNRDAVGARVAVRTGRGWQTREVSAGSGYLSGQSLVQHFGLGADVQASEVEIEWPSGTRTSQHALAAVPDPARPHNAARGRLAVPRGAGPQSEDGGHPRHRLLGRGQRRREGGKPRDPELPPEAARSRLVADARETVLRGARAGPG